MQEPIQGNGRDKVYGLASLGAEKGILSNSSRANPWVSRPIFGELPQAFNTLTLSETLKLTVPKQAIAAAATQTSIKNPAKLVQRVVCSASPHGQAMSHPSRQPTCEVAHPRVATMQQELHGLQAAASCCASHDQIAVARQLGVAPLQFAERYVKELRYVIGRAGDLMRFAHIEQPAFPITERPVRFCSVN